MKLSLAALLISMTAVEAGRPALSISVKDGSFGGLDGLDPTLSWSSSSSSGDVDLEFGVEASVRPTSDIASLPKSVWGKASGNSGDWAWSARADLDAADLSSADIEINADNDDLSVKLLASAGGGGSSVNNVEASKSFSSGDATITVNPRYSLADESGDVVIGWASGDTAVEVTASSDAQSIKIAQKIDDDNTITPTLASSGDISVEWNKSLGDGNSLSTTFSNSSVDLEWNDASWTASINVPLDGTDITGTNVSIKRDVEF
jgi:hypothetical protein